MFSMKHTSALTEPIVCSKQSTYMLYISSLSALSSCYAIYQNYYIYSLIPGTIFLTSINYWRYPVYGWRRNLDMTCVFCGATSIYIIAFNSSNCLLFYILMIMGASCYPISIYLYNNNMHYLSTLMHSKMHIFANIALIILFSGYIP